MVIFYIYVSTFFTYYVYMINMFFAAFVFDTPDEVVYQQRNASSPRFTFVGLPREQSLATAGNSLYIIDVILST